MSKSLYLKIQICLFSLCLTASMFAQQELETTNTESELLGDNFSLEGVLEMFKISESPEDFEAKINSESNSVNNLDLNEDGEIDYIRVVDNMEEDVHAIVLQIPVSQDESQDIAVIEMEKTSAENVVLQIIGDELLYGENHIVEPFEADSEQTGKGGPSAEFKIEIRLVNVWHWGAVQHVFRPNYRPYVSPWRWNHYPRTWRPWRPVTRAVFHPRVTRHRAAYRVAPTHRVVRAHNVYTPRRKSSQRVVSRRAANHNARNSRSTRDRNNGATNNRSRNNDKSRNSRNNDKRGGRGNGEN